MKILINITFLFISIVCASQTEEEIEHNAQLYYYDFINPTQKYNNDINIPSRNFEIDSINKTEIEQFNLDSRIPSKYENAAELALENLLKLWEMNIEKRALIYHAIQQLGCYLKKDLDYIKIPETKSFFPVDEFTNLKKNWKCDYTINYLFEMEFSKSDGDNIEKQLINLDEPNLYLQKSKNSDVYRFTWLRSFHNPIVIRIVSEDGKYYLYWKIGKGSGGYKPKGIKEKGKRKLSEEEWDIFETLIDHEEFINNRQMQMMVINDGAKWVLEEKSNEHYKAKLTNNPDTDFYRGCMYLIKLSGIKISEKETY